MNDAMGRWNKLEEKVMALEIKGRLLMTEKLKELCPQALNVNKQEIDLSAIDDFVFEELFTYLDMLKPDLDQVSEPIIDEI